MDRTAKTPDTLKPKLSGQAPIQHPTYQAPIPQPSMPQPSMPQHLPSQPDTPRFAWVSIVTIFAFICWCGIAAILCISILKLHTNAATYSPLQWAGIIGMLLGPVLMIGVASYSLKQLARLTPLAATLSHAVTELTQPDITAVRKSKTIAIAIGQQVDEVENKISTALGRLATLEDVLNVQTTSLAQSNIDATQTADHISLALSKQSEALGDISNTFDERMQVLSTMLTSHTDSLAEASNLAEQKIKEARISVEGATAKINSASDIVRTNTVQAAATLSSSHQDIHSLGLVLTERSEELENVYKKHANDLTSMIEELRDEQQNLGVVLEERLAKMRDLSLSAQASAESLIIASDAGRDTVEALAKSATLADTAVKARFTEMREMVQYSNEQAQSISEKAAQRVKDTLELTRKQILRIEDDMGDLQDRIGNPLHKSLEFVPVDDEAQHENPVDAFLDPSTQKRRWTRLKLKPVKEELHLTPLQNKGVNIPDVPQDINIQENVTLGLNDENDNFETRHPETNDVEDISEPSQPQAEPAPQTVQEPESAPSQDSVYSNDTSMPNITAQASMQEDAMQEGAMQDEHPIDFYTEPEALAQADPLLASIRQHTQDHLITRTLDTLPHKDKRPSFFRNLFGDKSEAQADASLSIANSPTDIAPAVPVVTPPAQSPTHDVNNIVEELSQLGLAPNVIVDDGCIIEAANARANQGHDVMSRNIGIRLKSPVEHLYKALTLDANLSQRTINFATEFDQSIETLGKNREAIRSHLESEHGRAYLLCDAALNYGRV